MNDIKNFWNEEDGIGVVEIILILVVLVALIVVFRSKITEIVKGAFESISTNQGTINNDISLK